MKEALKTEQQHPCVSCSPKADLSPCLPRDCELCPAPDPPSQQSCSPQLLLGFPTLAIFQKKHFSKAKNVKATALAVQLLKKHPRRHRSSGVWQGKPERGKVLRKHIQFLPCLFLTLQNVIETTKLAKRVLSALQRNSKKSFLFQWDPFELSAVASSTIAEVQTQTSTFLTRYQNPNSLTWSSKANRHPIQGESCQEP